MRPPRTPPPFVVVGGVFALVVGGTGTVPLDAGEEAVHPGFGGRDQEQRRTARVAVPPHGFGAVAGGGHLGPEASLVHGGEVHFHERPGYSLGAVYAQTHLGVGVGAEPAGTVIVGPVLPGVFVPTPLRQRQPDARASVEEGDVQAGNSGGVAEEQRVRRRFARGGRGALDQAGAGAGQPPEERGRARRRIRAGPVHQRAGP